MQRISKNSNDNFVFKNNLYFEFDEKNDYFVLRFSLKEKSLMHVWAKLVKLCRKKDYS